jgi:4-amino-4-deoxy-L-arabinose transferase-like glycosyltransferase
MTGWQRHQAIIHHVGILLLAGLVFFAHLGSAPLFDEDEPKNAVCGREMWLRGDWLVPTFNQELRTDKPILIYWMMLCSYSLFGINEFAARFGSSLMSLFTAVCVYHLGRLLFDRATGYWASLILCTCLMYAAVGRAVTPDATLIGWVTATFLAYVRAVARRHGGQFGQLPADQSPRRWDEFVPERWWHSMPLGITMGLAVLAKGPVGVVLPCGILVCFLLVLQQVQHRRAHPGSGSGTWWKALLHDGVETLSPLRVGRAVWTLRLPLVATVAASVALPWYVAVSWATNGEWLAGFWGNHNVGRFLKPMENHSGPFFYYVIVIALGTFPWSVFLPVAIWETVRAWRPRPLRETTLAGEAHDAPPANVPQTAAATCLPRGVQSHGPPTMAAALWLLACWAGLWIAFFSCAKTKLPNYVLPAYPALALILAWHLQNWRRLAGEESAESFRNCCRVLGGVSLAALLGVPIALRIFLPEEMWLTVLAVPPLLAATVAYSGLLRRQRALAVRALGMGAVCLAVLVVGIASQAVARHQDGPAFGQTLRQLAPAAPVELATCDYFSPNLVYYAAPRVERLHPSQVPAFFAEHPRGFLLTRADRLDRLTGDLPPDIAILARQPRFLRRHDLVLLGRPWHTAAPQSPSDPVIR